MNYYELSTEFLFLILLQMPFVIAISKYLIFASLSKDLLGNYFIVSLSTIMVETNEYMFNEVFSGYQLRQVSV